MICIVGMFSECDRISEESISIYNENSNVIIENHLVKVSFNTKRGIYTAFDKQDNIVCISNAVFSVNNSVSTDNFAFHWEKSDVNNELGTGKKLILKGEKKNQPSLLFEIALYEDKSFIELNVGVKNSTEKDIRIMDFYPLKGIAFENFTFNEYKTLDGECNTDLTQVQSADTLFSRNNLLATFGKKGERKRSLVIGGLSYNEFQKYASVIKHKDYLEVELKGNDPTGKLVDANSKYLLKDKFYIDFMTDNRFEALEKYGFALRDANNTEITGVDYPILNFWYAFHEKYGGDEFRNNSAGVVKEMEEIVKSGFLKYSPVAVRLEPDDYTIPDNQQGWWDDKHWQIYEGGQLIEPYETIVKWGKKIQELGGIPFIYFQTGRRSNDYCVENPDHCLFNTPYKLRSKGSIGFWSREDDTSDRYWAYDFTDPGFIRHMKEVYQNLKNGGVRGVKFDYPATGWSYDGGFEDKYATTTSAYRNIFKLAYEGLGKNSDVHERIPPYGDIALGVITTQRTEGDNDRVYPARISKTGMRWYKNRVVINYDHDPINPFHTYPYMSSDGWRTAITMTYLTSARMEIGKYFEEMTDEMLHDLSRAMPLLSTRKSPRPIDAFSGKEYPQIYDFEIDPSWHIVTFYNYDIEGEDWLTDAYQYGGIGLNKQFIPQKMLPAKINVIMGEKIDDGGLGLSAEKKYYVFDFWNWKFVGKYDGKSQLEQNLRPGETIIMAVHEIKEYPQFLSTNRHVLQGYLDMSKHPEWNDKSKELSGVSNVFANEDYKVIIATNGYPVKECSAGIATCKIELIDKQNLLYELSISSKENQSIQWTIKFE